MSPAVVPSYVILKMTKFKLELIPGLERYKKWNFLYFLMDITKPNNLYGYAMPKFLSTTEF